MPEFVPFNFQVHLYNESNNQMLCQGLFSEVQGLEVTMEPRAIQVGGRNWGEVQRIGLTKFSPIVLKRGVTELNDLWSWFDATTRGNNYGYRLQGEIRVLDPKVPQQGQERETLIIWRLSGVMPTRFKGPDLSSVANQVAIEEITLVHEGLTMERP
jgi:phage tail-like protein